MTTDDVVTEGARRAVPGAVRARRSGLPSPLRLAACRLPRNPEAGQGASSSAPAGSWSTRCSPASTARCSAGRAWSSPRCAPTSTGDDFRAIDWNVSARLGEPLRQDVHRGARAHAACWWWTSRAPPGSASRVTKAALAVEVAAVLALAAAYQNDRVGALLFADEVEQVVPPRQGPAARAAGHPRPGRLRAGGPAHQPRPRACPTPAGCCGTAASSWCSPISSPRDGSGRCAGWPRGTRSWRSRWTIRASTTCPTPGWIEMLGRRDRAGGCWWTPAAARCARGSRDAGRASGGRSGARALAAVGRRPGAPRRPARDYALPLRRAFARRARRIHRG